MQIQRKINLAINVIMNFKCSDKSEIKVTSGEIISECSSNKCKREAAKTNEKSPSDTNLNSKYQIF